ncbi:MAG: phage tail sheath subtilisin-like domain-containing protein [Hydrogenoanaerobacterium sp.]
MREYLSPGVYAEELNADIKSIFDVETGIVGFVGMTQRGTLCGTPAIVTSYMDFQKQFGGYLPKDLYGERRYLPLAVEQFFLNGGGRCFVMRVLDDTDAKLACAKIGNVTFTAANVGAWGNLVKILCGKDSANPTRYNLTLSCMDSENSKKVSYEENYMHVSLDEKSDGYIVTLLEKSLIVRAVVDKAFDDCFFEFTDEDEVLSTMMTGGADCAAQSKPSGGINAAILKGSDGGAGKCTGLCAFEDVAQISIIAAPGVTNASEMAEVVAHCESMGNRFCILDMPSGIMQLTELKAISSQVNSSFAARYYPWIKMYEPLEKHEVYCPPSGAIAGIYARVDNQYGVHKAPANVAICGCIELETQISAAEQDMINPLGINLIRAFPEKGFLVWGARTCSGDAALKYINVRRLLIFLKESIRCSIGWVAFEPNNQMLWTMVSDSITKYLGTQWRNGVMMGTSEAEAFFVKVGIGQSMTQDDVLNNRMICQIGVAPMRPSEFITFEIVQATEKSS